MRSQPQDNSPTEDEIRAIRCSSVLSNMKATNLFMSYLGSEFSMECLLSLIEFVQFQNYIMDHIERNIEHLQYQKNKKILDYLNASVPDAGAYTPRSIQTLHSSRSRDDRAGSSTPNTPNTPHTPTTPPDGNLNLSGPTPPPQNIQLQEQQQQQPMASTEEHYVDLQEIIERIQMNQANENGNGNGNSNGNVHIEALKRSSDYHPLTKSNDSNVSNSEGIHVKLSRAVNVYSNSPHASSQHERERERETGRAKEMNEENVQEKDRKNSHEIGMMTSVVSNNSGSDKDTDKDKERGGGGQLVMLISSVGSNDQEEDDHDLRDTPSLVANTTPDLATRISQTPIEIIDDDDNDNDQPRVDNMELYLSDRTERSYNTMGTGGGTSATTTLRLNNNELDNQLSVTRSGDVNGVISHKPNLVPSGSHMSSIMGFDIEINGFNFGGNQIAIDSHSGSITSGKMLVTSLSENKMIVSRLRSKLACKRYKIYFNKRIPKSSIVYDDNYDHLPIVYGKKQAGIKQLKKKCYLLYSKYVAVGSEFEINISYHQRQNYISKIDNFQAFLRNSQINEFELLNIFVPCMDVVMSLMQDNFRRFKREPAFQRFVSDMKKRHQTLLRQTGQLGY